MAQAFIDPESVRRYSHILLNSFGGDNESVAAQIHQVSFGPEDALLLCTDGLTDMVPENEIAAELEEAVSPQAACDALVERALAHGGRDNVTVAIASATLKP